MMKLVSRLLLIGVFLMLGVGKIEASEGTAWLDGDSGEQCYVSAIMVEPSRYEIMMSCRGLEVPPETESLYYVAWVKRLEDDRTAFEREYINLGVLNTGKLSTTVRNSFEELLVTVEKTASSNTPSEKMIMSGTMEELVFTLQVPEIKDSVVKVQITPTPKPDLEIVDEKVEEEEMGSVVGRIGRFFLITLGVVVVIAVIISVIQKRTAEK